MVYRGRSTGRGGGRKKSPPPKKSSKKTVDKNTSNSKSHVGKITDNITGKNDTLHATKITPSKTQAKDNNKALEEKNTPTTTNAQIIQIVAPVNQDDTLKNSEKPPEINSDVATTYKSTLLDTINTPMTDPTRQSTFLIQKRICEPKIMSCDDSTAEHDNFTIKDFPNSVRTTMMYKLPEKKDVLEEEHPSIIGIHKMNEMLKALTNKTSCRVGPWKPKDKTTKLRTSDLLTELPEDVDFVESYVFDFNRFLALGKTGYVRLNIFYSEETSLSEIKGVIDQFRIPRIQFMELARSNAISPVQIGTLTGSVEAMANSRDFNETFKDKFGLSELGLWWTQPRQVIRAEYSNSKCVLHLEIENKDLGKRPAIEQFFNHSTRGIDNTFFGTPMLLTKAFNYFADDDLKANLSMHSRKQVSLGKSLTSTVIAGVGLNNWVSLDKQSTLLRELMSVESITEKTIMKGKTATKFKGRLFYAIVPNHDTKGITFYFTKANASEGRSVARGLPLFIRDHFQLDPAFFCSSEVLTDSLGGSWDYHTRKFLSAQEKMEVDRLDEMEMEANAEPQAYISKDHQRAMALDNDEVSVETRLTKGDAAPPPAVGGEENDELSAMTGSTRESKAKKYAETAVKEVVAEYSGTIVNMTSDLEAKDDEITKLRMMLSNLKNSERRTKPTKDKDNLGINIGDNDEGGTTKSSDLSYESEDLSTLDPLAFTPIFEKDITDPTNIPLPLDTGDVIESVIDSEQVRKKKRGSPDEVDKTNLQRPRISPQVTSNTKPSSSGEPMVL